MLVAVIGESCVGKSTFADRLKEMLDAEVCTGKDYLRFAKNEAVAMKLFSRKLSQAIEGENLIYVITEKEHLALLPDGTVRVLMTADLELILERFSGRLHGILPPPVKQMLERKHGCFDVISREYHIHNSKNLDAVCQSLIERVGVKP